MADHDLDAIMKQAALPVRSGTFLDPSLVQRQLARRTGSALQPPPHEAPDTKNWLGQPRDSPQLARHRRVLQATYLAARKAGYAQDTAASLAVYSLRRVLHAVAVEEAELAELDPGSLAAELGLHLLLDSAARLKEGTDRIQRAFFDHAMEEW